MEVVGLERPGTPVVIERADPRPQIEQHPEGEEPGNAVHHSRGGEIVEPEVDDQPAVPAPAPGSADDPHECTEEHGEHQIGGDPDALDGGSRHDRAGGPGEQQERRPEDGHHVVSDVRAHQLAPWVTPCALWPVEGITD